MLAGKTRDMLVLLVFQKSYCKHDLGIFCLLINWHVVKHGVESGVTFGVNFELVFFYFLFLFKNAFCFINKNINSNLLPVGGII